MLEVMLHFDSIKNLYVYVYSTKVNNKYSLSFFSFVLNIDFQKMYLVLVAIVLISSCLTGFFGKQLGSTGSIKIEILILLVALLSIGNSSHGFTKHRYINTKNTMYFSMEVFNSIDYINNFIDFLNFNNLVILVCLIVVLISLFLDLYSVQYSNDSDFNKFLSYLSLYAFLISTSNYTSFLQLYLEVSFLEVLNILHFIYIKIQNYLKVYDKKSYTRRNLNITSLKKTKVKKTKGKVKVKTKVKKTKGKVKVKTKGKVIGFKKSVR